MSLVNSILNFAGLLIWISWRQAGFKAAIPPGISLAGTLKPAGESGRRWTLLAGLLLLLVLRALFYWQSGAITHWAGGLPAGPIVLQFRGDLPDRMLLFSFLSFSQFLGTFYIWLLLFSAANHKTPDAGPQSHWVRLQLGWADGLPVWLKLLMPFAATLAVWAGLSPAFTALGLLPPAVSARQWIEQAVVLSSHVYLLWRYPIALVLVLHLLSNHIYFGKSGFWNYIHSTAKRFLGPFSALPLRFGSLDVVPLVAAVAVLLASEHARRGLGLLYERLIR